RSHSIQSVVNHSFIQTSNELHTAFSGNYSACIANIHIHIHIHIHTHTHTHTHRESHMNLWAVYVHQSIRPFVCLSYTIGANFRYAICSSLFFRGHAFFPIDVCVYVCMCVCMYVCVYMCV
ncbi:hypothetical protein LOAG_11253, partial [Loa loa]